MNKKTFLTVGFFAVLALAFAISIGQVEAKPICSQVVTYAANPGTLECKEFSTPCDVPVGWVTTDDCGGYIVLP